MIPIEDMLSEDEEVIVQAELHWIYISTGFLWFFTLALPGVLFDDFMLKMMDYFGELPDIYDILGYTIILHISLFEMICIIGGGLVFLVYYLKYISTFVWVTSKRIIYKTGLIFVKIKETDLQEIKEERVDQGWFGSFLDYGAVYLDCRFVADLQLPEIRDPLRFMKAVYKAREHLGHQIIIE